MLRRLVALLGVSGVIALVLLLRRRRERLTKLPPPRPPPPPASQRCAASTSKDELVAVTGANGYLGAACCELLLLRGHCVRPCVRGEPSDECYSFLHGIAQALGAGPALDTRAGGGCALTADCTAAFQRAFEGCTTVVHTAMPMDNAGLVFESDAYVARRAQLVAGTREPAWYETLRLQAQPPVISRDLA